MQRLKLSRFKALLLTMPDDVLTNLFAFMNPREIAKCSTLSTVVLNVVHHYKTLVWDPDKFFRHWFRDSPISFRLILKKCGAIVSGSQIMQFFDRSNYIDSDMDIFLRVGGLIEMGAWLWRQGYNLHSSSSTYRVLWDAHRLSAKLVQNQDPTTNAIKGVFNFTRYVASATVIYLQKIQLVTVDVNPINHILFDFHSTAVINYMLPDSVVSVFPLSTFLHRKTYVCRSKFETASRADEWKNKYRERGFRIIRKRSRGDHKDMILGKRSCKDQHCWIIKLPRLFFPPRLHFLLLSHIQSQLSLHAGRSMGQRNQMYHSRS
ncbi:hypothetical protein C8R43DRAFT_885137 [Mycena crocata]|nr:hypothetical protein C8R43DRAFT_885137 [Mycena crocata]